MSNVGTTVGYAYLPDYDYETEGTGLNALSDTAGTGIQLVVQLTNAGVQLLETSRTPPVLKYFTLNDGYGYVPTESQTSLQGSEVHRDLLVAPLVDTGNYLCYSIDLPENLGPLSYGEIGLFDEHFTLIAVAVATSLIHKNPITVENGGPQSLDLYVPMVGENYPFWFAYAQQPNELRASVLTQLEGLPQGRGAVTNVYIVQGASTEQSSFLAYTDRLGLWMFDAYQFSNQRRATVLNRTNHALVISVNEWETQLSPTYFGKVILQFTEGPMMGVCRYLKTATISNDGQFVTLELSASLTGLPNVGDTVAFLVRDELSVLRRDLPIATTTELGAIVVGPSLKIDLLGNLDVRREALPVTSVNGQEGDVEISADEIPGLAPVAITGSYGDLTGTPAPYVLPVASFVKLGGVRIANSGAFTINNGVLDFNGIPVRSVNSLLPDAQGNIVVPPPVGLINATEIVAALNTVVTPGLYYAEARVTNAPPGAGAGTLEVTPLPGGSTLQVWFDGVRTYQRTQSIVGVWTSWSTNTIASDIGTATHTSLGLVSIGNGIEVSNGQISLNLAQPNGIATLNEYGKVPSAQLPDAITGALVYQGVWDAQNNVPALASGVGQKGWYYKVSTPSIPGHTTELDGLTEYKVGDIIAFNGNTWDKIAASPDNVSSVAGRIGDVTLTWSDIPDLSLAAKTGNFYDLTFRPFAVSTWLNDVGYLTANQTITLSGDVTGSGTTTIPVTLVDSGIIAGEYTKITFDAKGRATSGTQLTPADIATALGYTPYNAANPANYITSGQAPVQSVFGRVGAVVLTSADVTTALGFTPANKAGDTITGALTIATVNYPLIVNSTNSYAVKQAWMDNGVARGYQGANSVYNNIFYNAAGASVATIDNSGNIVASGDVTAYSDRRRKTEVEPISGALDKIKTLNGVTWKWLESKKSGLGLIAQEVLPVFPEVVHFTEDGTMSLAYGNLVGALVEAIKELDANLSQAKAAAKGLEARVAAIEAKLAN